MPAEDGELARCVGPWSRDKLYYVARYLTLFARAMAKKFPERHYVDLFAGPGCCVLDDDTGEIDGSPLIALAVAPPFTGYHFGDRDPEVLAVLRRRGTARRPEALIHYYDGDANDMVGRVTSALPPTALSVAVIDPTGLQFRFEALRALTANRRMDLIYLFPEGMAVRRNLEAFLVRPWGLLDDALGTNRWRPQVQVRRPQHPGDEWEGARRLLVEVLREQLTTLGYRHVRLGSEVVVRNRRNASLYSLVFASKHALGHAFWQAISKDEPTGQRRLF